MLNPFLRKREGVFAFWIIQVQENGGSKPQTPPVKVLLLATIEACISTDTPLRGSDEINQQPDGGRIKA
jgi:hypothetical protein